METPYLDREIKAIIVQAALQPLSEEQKAILAEYKAIKEALSMPIVVQSFKCIYDTSRMREKCKEQCNYCKENL